MRKEWLMEKVQKAGGIVKTSDLLAWGLTYRMLEVFLKDESLVRVKNGYYSLGKKRQTQAELMTNLFPDGVLTMETALFYYGYQKQQPFSWQIAVNKNTSKSRFSMTYPVVVPIYTEPEVLQLGVTQAVIENCTMDIYNRDRLICDCLKQEERFTHNQFKEILRAYIADEEKNIHQLLYYAKERKVQTKVKYLIGVWL